MTAPTREQVEGWAREADPAYDVLGILHTVEDLQSFASVAITNGAQLHPLHEAASAVVKVLNDPTLDVPIATAAKIGQQVVALERALAFAAGQSSVNGSGAELVREVDQIEQALTDSVRAFEASGMNPKMQNRALWSLIRLRAALLSGDAAREDAERLAWVIDNPQSYEDLMEGLWYRSEIGALSPDEARAEIDRARGGK